jgi:hypothetical protein
LIYQIEAKLIWNQIKFNKIDILVFEFLNTKLRLVCTKIRIWNFYMIIISTDTIFFKEWIWVWAILPKTVWPKNVWPKTTLLKWSFDQNLFDWNGHLIETSFDRNGHLTEMVIWPKWLFDRMFIWPKIIWLKYIYKYIKVFWWRIYCNIL